MTYWMPLFGEKRTEYMEIIVEASLDHTPLIKEDYGCFSGEEDYLDE